MTQSLSRTEAFTAHRRGDLKTAERLYRALLATTPDDPELNHYLGALAYQTGRLDEAILLLQAALSRVPGALPTLQLLTRAHIAAGNPAAALPLLDRYLTQRPDDAPMLNVRAQQLAQLDRLQAAEQSFLQAARLSGDAAMYADLGHCRQLLGQLPGAIDAYNEALTRGHDHPRTRLWLAQCLRGMGRIGEYHAMITAASQSAPGDIELLIEAQSARRHLCDWDDFDRHQPQLLAGLDRILAQGEQSDVPPGLLNFLEVDETTISAFARVYASQFHAQPVARTGNVSGCNHGKLRLGYLSTDFFDHAVGQLVRNLFTCHDRDRFQVYGYSLRHQPDAVQSDIQHGCDTYRNLSGCSDAGITEYIVRDSIDVLVDLAGYTSAARPAVLGRRPAPVQISWLGYLGTSGSNCIDYIIADAVTLPAELAHYYTEKIIRLPCFLPASRLAAQRQCVTRGAYGLPKTGPVFCSFNQPYKLDRRTFTAWMAILGHVPDSVLWMLEPDTGLCKRNLCATASRLGIAPDRLVFAGREPMARHIARLGLADLSLDPFHISGGTTSVATLSAGVPVLTLRGHSFLARIGSSINACLGMTDLDCANPEQYITRAVELATDPALLATTAKRLDAALKFGGFFDTRLFVKYLEAGLIEAWRRHSTGHAADDINISR